MLVKELGNKGILCFPLSKNIIRMVTHLEIKNKHLNNIVNIINDYSITEHNDTPIQNGDQTNNSNEDIDKSQYTAPSTSTIDTTNNINVVQVEEEYGSWNTN